MPKKIPQPQPQDNESIQSETDDLIKDLVEKYAGGTAEPADEHVEEDSEEKPAKRKKRQATEKQKKHLEKTREVALQKRREYAAERKAAKEAAKKKAYQDELSKEADKKVRVVLEKIASQKKSVKPKPKPKKKAVPEDRVGSVKYRPKVVIVEESDESDEDSVVSVSSSEDEIESDFQSRWVGQRPTKIVQVRKPRPQRTRTKKTPVVKVRTSARRPTPSPWDDYDMY